jgi:hypothetical protein
MSYMTRYERIRWAAPSTYWWVPTSCWPCGDLMVTLWWPRCDLVGECNVPKNLYLIDRSIFKIHQNVEYSCKLAKARLWFCWHLIAETHGLNFIKQFTYIWGFKYIFVIFSCKLLFFPNRIFTTSCIVRSCISDIYISCAHYTWSVIIIRRPRVPSCYTHSY